MKLAFPLVPVESSQFQAVGYDGASKTLAIRFNPSKKVPAGTVYTYANVPSDVHEEFMAAESKGKFFGERIKGHADKFPFQKIDEDEEHEGDS